ncbi:MAG: hypothetical protein J6H18_03445, partial [Lachnospiraceae bacterium]|nr:hypothetical protein [Lachnospiraceae bacterium]
MKAKIKKNIVSAMAVLLALLLVFTGIRVHAAWSDYGLPDSGTGSIKLSLYYEEDRGGSRSRVYIDGVSFELYRVWTISSDGKATVHAPFDTLLSPEDLVSADTEFDELEGAAPSDSVRKLARDMAALCDLAALYATTALSDHEGRIMLSDIPFGGYLFVPVNEAGSITKLVLNPDGSRKEYIIDPFLVSVPVCFSQAEGTIPAGYKAEVDAFVKISIGCEEVPTTEPPTTTEPPA